MSQFNTFNALPKRLNRRYTYWHNRFARKLGAVPIPEKVPISFVELTSRCNLRCNMCPHPSLKRPQADMEWDLYTHIIDEIAGLGAWYVGLNRFGESLLYPRLAEAIRYAKSRGIERVLLITNGTLVTPEKTAELLESGLDSISFSLDTLDKVEYEANRRGAQLERTMANVDQFIEERARRGLTKPEICINSVMVHEQMDRIRELFGTYYERVDRIIMKPIAQYGVGQDLDQVEHAPRRNLRPCIQPWERMNFFQDGKVNICCGDVEGELIVGDVRETSVRDLWLRVPRVREIRRLHHRLQFGTLPVCQACDGISQDYYDRAFAQQKRIYDELNRKSVV